MFEPQEMRGKVLYGELENASVARWSGRSLANFTVLIPMDRRDDRPAPGGMANPLAPDVQRDPEDDDGGRYARHGAVGVLVA